MIFSNLSRSHLPILLSINLCCIGWYYIKTATSYVKILTLLIGSILPYYLGAKYYVIVLAYMCYLSLGLPNKLVRLYRLIQSNPRMRYPIVRYLIKYEFLDDYLIEFHG